MVRRLFPLPMAIGVLVVVVALTLNGGLSTVLANQSLQNRDRVPDCSDPKRWPTLMAIAYLKNIKVLDPTRLDQSKTKARRIASEPLGKGVYRQVHHVTLMEKTGKTIEAITVNDASTQECSMSDVDVFVVTRGH